MRVIFLDIVIEIVACALIVAAAAGLLIGTHQAFQVWMQNRKQRAEALAKKPPECTCPICQARRAHTPILLPMPLQQAVLAGLELVRTGRTPATAWRTDVMGSNGVGNLAVVVIDGGIWDRVAAPAIEAHVRSNPS